MLIFKYHQGAANGFIGGLNQCSTTAILTLSQHLLDKRKKMKCIYSLHPVIYLSSGQTLWHVTHFNYLTSQIKDITYGEFFIYIKLGILSLCIDL